VGSDRRTVLAIAATDSSGGAGIARDVQVLASFGVDAMCVVTAVTAQSDARVTAVHHTPPEIIRAQMEAAFETRRVDAIKIGMLGGRATVDAIIDSLPRNSNMPMVLDPVLVSSSGGILLDVDGREAMREHLLPRATLLTPNVPEAATLLDEDVATSESSLIGQARRLLALGPQAVLLKGGHASGAEAVDLLVTRTGEEVRIASPRLNSTCRGTGCSLASAIAAGLASGLPLLVACQRAKRFVESMLTSR